MSDASKQHEFTNSWFAQNIPIWDAIVLPTKPKRVLEIGSYEGQSSCYFLGKCADLEEMHCIDTWDGGIEHQQVAMGDVERRFHANTAIEIAKRAAPAKLVIHKGYSAPNLAKLIAEKVTPFDVIYVDGSHQAPDVLADAVLSFQLLRVGGLIVFDDYLWSMEGTGKQDLLNMPKLAVDAFVNIYYRKLKMIVGFPICQFFAQKIAD